MTDEHKMAMMHTMEHHIGRRCLGGGGGRAEPL